MVLLLTCVLVSYPKFSGKGYIFSRRDVCVFTWLFAICSSVVCDELHTHTHTHTEIHTTHPLHTNRKTYFFTGFSLVKKLVYSWRSKEFLLTETVLLVKIFVLTHTYTHTWWRLSLLKN